MSRGLRFALAWCVMSGAGCASVRVHRFSGAPAPIASVAMVGFRGTPTAIADGIREGCRQAILRRQLRVVSADYRTLSASGQENFYQETAQLWHADALLVNTFSFDIEFNQLTTSWTRLLSPRTGEILVAVMVETNGLGGPLDAGDRGCGAALDAALSGRKK